MTSFEPDLLDPHKYSRVEDTVLALHNIVNMRRYKLW